MDIVKTTAINYHFIYFYIIYIIYINVILFDEIQCINVS